MTDEPPVGSSVDADDTSAPVSDATDASETAAEQPETRSEHGSFWRELPFLVLIALVLALLIKTFLVQAFYIPSASMENTLQGGGDFANSAATGDHPFDRVLVNKLVYDFRSPHRGEIIVFKGPPGWPKENTYTPPSNAVLHFFHDVGSAIGIAPSGGSDFIKRVIAVGGDTVSCQNDVLSVNGHVLHEPYLYPGSHQCSAGNFNGETWTVPKSQLFVMGDHRDDSEDSRVNKFVPVSDVVGRAFIVIWPIKDWKTLPVPGTFKQAGLAAAGSPATPALAGIVLTAPIALIRRRKHKRRTLTFDGSTGPDRTA